MSFQWTYPGARWLKFDFHTHTPASKDTDAWQRAMGTADELTAKQWLLKYMPAKPISLRRPASWKRSVQDLLPLGLTSSRSPSPSS